MTKTKTTKRTLAQIKEQVNQLGLVVHKDYDRRFKNTWLYTLGEDVEPVLKNKIVHVSKKPKKKLKWADLTAMSQPKEIKLDKDDSKVMAEVLEAVEEIPTAPVEELTDEMKLAKLQEVMAELNV